MKILKAYRLKLYPSKAARQALARHAGACRWLWNRLLAMQVAQYGRDGTFTFFHDMSKMLPGLKREFAFLAEAPSNSLVRVCRNLDRALKDCARRRGKGRKGFPKFKARGRCKDSFYVINQALRIDAGGRRAFLPKLGPARFRTGRLPEGRIAGASVSRVADGWWLTVQCETEEEIAGVIPVTETVIAADLGVADLLVRSDGVKAKAPRRLRGALKRLRCAQRTLARRRKGGKNRARQARLVARIHAKVADQRRGSTHQATAALVKAASAVVTEDLHVAGMMKNRRLALSLADASLGETLRQVAYKCQWAGKAHVMAGRFEPSTQRCSSCGTVKSGAGRLRLHHRTYRCGCGHEMDRDLNAALNLRHIGLEALGLEDVGQAMPERVREIRLPADACGEASGGRVSQATFSRASRNQEPELSSTGLSG